MDEVIHKRKIKILKNGPYLVTGDVPLAEEIIIIGGDNEPESWSKGRLYPRAPQYSLCRCGASKSEPFCDGTHLKIGFDGTETAGREYYLSLAERTTGPEIDLTFSRKHCVRARFCQRAGDAWVLAKRSDVPSCRETAIQEACDCPSGALVAWNKKIGEVIEPNLEPSIGLIENPRTGLSGPIWVRGRIPIESSDGTIYEVRNRVTLCRCGASKIKPLCDGVHIDIKFKSKS
jgi:CDGSH-type Zn-finger protein